MFHVFFLFFFFLQFYEHPDLGKNIFTTWNVLKSEVYLTCINFRKFNDDLKASLEVIKLPSWPKNVKFSVKMQFFTFLTPWKIHLELMINLKLSFSEVDLEVFTFPKNHYLYIKIWTSKGTSWKSFKSHSVLKFSRKNQKLKSDQLGLYTTEIVEISILNEIIKWWRFQKFLIWHGSDKFG